MNAEMQEGTIAMWNGVYGFIAVAGRADLFFHHSSIEPRNFQPERGAAIRFIVGRDKKGREMATKVFPIHITAEASAR